MKYWEQQLMRYKQHIVTPDELRKNPKLRAFRRLRILVAVMNPAVSMAVLALIFLGVL